MRDKVLAYCRAQGFFSPGDTLLCAVSGGKDSVALLHVMCALQKELDIHVEAVHVNHQLRGEESERDEDFVRALCKELSVPLHVARVDVRARAAMRGESLEEAARALRYEVFESFKTPLATAHTQDDNLETVLLNLIRGTALRGLCGIPPARGKIIRPMLCASREDVASYLSLHGLCHVEDSSNASDLPLRNRIRHDVLPLLQRENPALGESVFRMDEILRQEDAYLDRQAAALLEKARRGGGLSCSELRNAEDVICARAMRKLLQELKISKPTSAHVEALMQLISVSSGSQELTLPGRTVMRRAYDTLYSVKPDAPAGFAAQTLSPGKDVFLPELSMRVSSGIVKNYQKNLHPPCTFAFRYDTIKTLQALTIRPRRAGDEIFLSGGRKSLKKLLIDRKVPSDRRSLVPVVCEEDAVLLAYPFAASCKHAAQEGFPALLIQFTKEKE